MTGPTIHSFINLTMGH